MYSFVAKNQSNTKKKIVLDGSNQVSGPLLTNVQDDVIK